MAGFGWPDALLVGSMAMAGCRISFGNPRPPWPADTLLLATMAGPPCGYDRLWLANTGRTPCTSGCMLFSLLLDVF